MRFGFFLRRARFLLRIQTTPQSWEEKLAARYDHNVEANDRQLFA